MSMASRARHALLRSTAVDAAALRRTSSGVDLTDQLKLLVGERASMWLRLDG